LILLSYAEVCLSDNTTPTDNDDPPGISGVVNPDDPVNEVNEDDGAVDGPTITSHVDLARTVGM
jgi:hypothetical protein